MFHLVGVAFGVRIADLMGERNWWVTAVATFAATVGPSMVSYELLERRFLRLQNRFESVRTGVREEPAQVVVVEGGHGDLCQNPKNTMSEMTDPNSTFRDSPATVAPSTAPATVSEEGEVSSEPARTLRAAEPLTSTKRRGQKDVWSTWIPLCLTLLQLPFTIWSTSASCGQTAIQRDEREADAITRLAEVLRAQAPDELPRWPTLRNWTLENHAELAALRASITRPDSPREEKKALVARLARAYRATFVEPSFAAQDYCTGVLKEFAQVGQAVRNGGIDKGQPATQIGPLVKRFVQGVLPRCALVLTNAGGSVAFWSRFLDQDASGSTPDAAYAVLAVDTPLVGATAETLAVLGISTRVPNGIGIFGRPIADVGWAVHLGPCGGGSRIANVEVDGLEFLVQGRVGATFTSSGPSGDVSRCLRLQSERPHDFIEISLLPDGVIRAVVEAGGRALSVDLPHIWTPGEATRLDLEWDFLADRPQQAMLLRVGASSARPEDTADLHFEIPVKQ